MIYFNLLPMAATAGIFIILLTVILVLVGILMVGLIMLQESKGGGLSALGGTSASATLGVSNPLRRATVVLAIVFFLLAVFINIIGKGEAGHKSRLENALDQESQQSAPKKDSSGMLPSTGDLPVKKAVPSPEEKSLETGGAGTNAEQAPALSETPAESAKPEKSAAGKSETNDTSDPGK